MRLWFRVALLVSIVGICASAGSADDETYPGRLTFHSAVLDREIILHNGEFSEAAAEGSASRHRVKIIKMLPAGNIGEREMRILVLNTETGGSGSFTELALITHGDDSWKITDSLLLGDRVRVEGVEPTEYGIAVTLLVHGANDPRCCPGEISIRRYRISEMRLQAADVP